MAPPQQRVIICGFGHLGQALVQQLQLTDLDVLIVEDQPDYLRLAREMSYPTHRGNPTEEIVLQEAGIEQAHCLATVLSDDASNLFITLTARELNPRLLIIAQGNLPETEPSLRLAGADYVVSPASISAQRMVHLITRPHTLDFLDQQSDGPISPKQNRTHLIELLNQLNVQIDQLVIPGDSPLKGLSLEEVESKARGMLIVIALRRASGKLLTQLQPTLQIEPGDTAIVLGHQEDISLFTRQYVQKTEMRYRGKRL